MGLIFFGIAILVTKDNARYLLAGYNTMKEEERERFNLEAFIPYFRKFHIGLGIVILIIGRILYYYVSERWVGLFLGVFPLSAYIYFLIKSRQYSGPDAKASNIGLYVLIGALIFVIFLFILGSK